MRRLTLALALLAVSSAPIAAQTPAAPAAPAPPPSPNMDVRVIPLWEGRAPGALGDEPADRPTLTYFPARGGPGGTGTAVVVAPGGGYGALAMNHEGRQVANFLNGLGVSAFVLQYRLGPRYRHPVELGDAQRAIRLVRARAAEFNLQTDRIGMMGFSAGGHLTSSAGTHFDAGNASAADPVDRVSSRPDFLVLGYPVIALGKPYTHMGSQRNLLGDNPPASLIAELSSEQRVTAQTPPTFLFHTTADTGVPAENSIVFYQALVRAGVPAEMHIFATGPHGVGLAMGDPALGEWPGLLANWLRGRGLLTPAPRPN